MWARALSLTSILTVMSLRENIYIKVLYFINSYGYHGRFKWFLFGGDPEERYTKL